MNPQLVDLQDLIWGVLLRYDPATRLTRSSAGGDMYRREAGEILTRLRLVSPRSFLQVRNIVGDVLFPLGAAELRGESSRHGGVKAAEEIWQAWAFYGLQD
jgi:hypothetical protein